MVELKKLLDSEGAKQSIDRLELKSFWGLFLLSGIACFINLLSYVIRMAYRFIRHSNSNLESSSRSTRLRSFLSFVNEKEGEDKYRPKEKCCCRKVSHDVMSVISHYPSKFGWSSIFLHGKDYSTNRDQILGSPSVPDSSHNLVPFALVLAKKLSDLVITSFPIDTSALVPQNNILECSREVSNNV
ncbi:Glutamate receptor 3.6 [Spatholobus suberectus]|nr:Glutamate receptor 3.6 [Spatholobus suberectus]